MLQRYAGFALLVGLAGGCAAERGPSTLPRATTSPVRAADGDVTDLRQGRVVAGSRLTWEVEAGVWSDDMIAAWLVRAMQTVAAMGGHFPSARVHATIVPVISFDRPVLFGVVKRGQQTSVTLYVSHDATLDQLASDWVAVHEFSHLWLPPFRGESQWFGEGVATYLQELLRARCGVVSPERAWDRIQAGFERGRKAATKRTLAQESRAMRRTGAFHRVYWAGAAFALEANALLHGRALTLEEALLRAYATWGGHTRQWRWLDALNTLADAAGEPELIALGKRYADDTKFPVWSEASRRSIRDAFLEDAARPASSCGAVTASD